MYAGVRRCLPSNLSRHLQLVPMTGSILIVDDNPQILRLLRTFLEAVPGFHICGEAVDGLEAIKKAGELHPDMVILDLSMPRMNGLQAARVLRATRTDMPIILFTLYADLVKPAEASAAGVTAVFSKNDLHELAKQAECLLQAAYH